MRRVHLSILSSALLQFFPQIVAQLTRNEGKYGKGRVQRGGGRRNVGFLQQKSKAFLKTASPRSSTLRKWFSWSSTIGSFRKSIQFRTCLNRGHIHPIVGYFSPSAIRMKSATGTSASAQDMRSKYSSYDTGGPCPGRTR